MSKEKLDSFFEVSEMTAIVDEDVNSELTSLLEEWKEKVQFIVSEKVSCEDSQNEIFQWSRMLMERYHKLASLWKKTYPTGCEKYFLSRMQDIRQDEMMNDEFYSLCEALAEKSDFPDIGLNDYSLEDKIILLKVALWYGHITLEDDEYSNFRGFDDFQLEEWWAIFVHIDSSYYFDSRKSLDAILDAYKKGLFNEKLSI